MTSSGPALIEMTGVEKRFGTTRALRGVDLTLSAGECLGLVGRNGAGKSTIVSILSGLAEPDAGQVRFAGDPAPRVGDIARWREWIATVFQHSMIVADLSVAENVFLGDMARVLSWRELRARTREIMSDWGFDIPAEARCRELSVEQLQIVEIARALARGAKCVLLDEPTAALEREAVRRLFERVRQLTAGGVAVLYISHHLEEVFEICQRVEVLRDGERVLTAPLAGLTRDDLIAAMVGSAQVRAAASSDLGSPAGERGPADQARPRDPRRQPPPPGDTAPPDDTVLSEDTVPPDDTAVLTVADLTSDSPQGRLSGVSLQVGKGEIVGVTGLLSAGVATIGRTIAGAETRRGGEVRLHGALVPSGRRQVAQRAGIGYIPEDRRTEGFVPHLGVAENTTMTIMDRLSDSFGLVRPGRRAAAAAPITSRLSLVSSGPGQPVEELSGGNQQKITVARTLAHEPSLIVAITPTRGVDVASKALLLDSLADVARSRGAGVLLCSDELSDLVICDRVIVLVRGQVFAEFTEPPFDRDELIVATEGLSGSDLDSAYEAPAHETTAHDTTSHDPTAHDAAAHDTAAHDTPREAAE